jgi:ParB family transcriptional regulator, chromosome partitioning protein
MNLPISSIRVQASIRFDAGTIQALAENIAEFGLLHPVIVNDQNELVAGYRRLKAAELLGWPEIPVTVISPNNDLKKFDASLHENCRRKDLNPLELCEAILERKHRWEQIHGSIKCGPQTQNTDDQNNLLPNGKRFAEETAKVLGTNATNIYRLLELKGLDADIKQQLEDGSISYRAALAMQSDRKKAAKQQPKSRPQGIPGLPDRETALQLQAEYSRNPVLMQIMAAVSHLYRIYQQTQPEMNFHLDKSNPDRLVFLLGQLSSVIEWLIKLRNDIQTELMNQMQIENKQ